MQRALRRATKLLYLVAAPGIGAAWPSRGAAQSEQDFKGKTIRLIIGTSTGCGVDLYARLVTQFLGKHLPGEPTILPQNMPGASSLVAANYVYNS
jgi:tripartite-type tricarboxylate transporter receptor subunit TctC